MNVTEYKALIAAIEKQEANLKKEIEEVHVRLELMFRAGQYQPSKVEHFVADIEKGSIFLNNHKAGIEAQVLTCQAALESLKK